MGILVDIRRKVGQFDFPPASGAAVQDAETQLGFPLPPLLKACYLELGNGGYGPGYGIFGLAGGFSSHGNLVEYYQVLCGAEEPYCWPRSLLPMVDWGCATYSCVHREDPRRHMATSESGEIWKQSYNLESFFRMWLDDLSPLDCDGVENYEEEIINPFTRKPMMVQRRRRVGEQYDRSDDDL